MTDSPFRLAPLGADMTAAAASIPFIDLPAEEAKRLTTGNGAKSISR